MAPFGRQPGVVEVQPAHHGADVERAHDGIQLVARAGHARSARHGGAGHHRPQQPGAGRELERLEAAGQRVHETVLRGLVGLRTIYLVVLRVVGERDQQLVGVRPLCGLVVVGHSGSHFQNGCRMLLLDQFREPPHRKPHHRDRSTCLAGSRHPGSPRRIRPGSRPSVRRAVDSRHALGEQRVDGADVRLLAPEMLRGQVAHRRPRSRVRQALGRRWQSATQARQAAAASMPASRSDHVRCASGTNLRFSGPM